MFLFVSVRHVGAHPDEHQRGVSIQISINLGKMFLRISRIRNIPLTWILARVFHIFTSFQCPDSGLYLLNGFDFYFNLFWMAWHWKPAIGQCWCIQLDEALLWFLTNGSFTHTIPFVSKCFKTAILVTLKLA